MEREECESGNIVGVENRNNPNANHSNSLISSSLEEQKTPPNSIVLNSSSVVDSLLEQIQKKGNYIEYLECQHRQMESKIRELEQQTQSGSGVRKEWGRNTSEQCAKSDSYPKNIRMISDQC